MSLSNGSNTPRISLTLGGDYLELTAEEERRLISKDGVRIVPQLEGFCNHYQLLDQFSISSVGTIHLFFPRQSDLIVRNSPYIPWPELTQLFSDPNFAYVAGSGKDWEGLTCVNLRTGEWRPLNHLWGASRLHCVCTGFGFVAFVTFSTIFIAEEGNWNHIWTRNNLAGPMLNSCVLTKLLGEDGQPDEVVLIVGSNGGAVYTCSLPKAVPDEYIVVDLPSEDDPDIDPNSWRHWGEGVDQSDVPLGQRRVLKGKPKQQIEIKQCLVDKREVDTEVEDEEETSMRIQNINCLTQGKGIYTDYLIGAPDSETRLYIFIRSYEGKSDDYWQIPRSYRDPATDATEVVFELVEQQRNPKSIILPISAKPPSDWVPNEEMSDEEYNRARNHIAETQPSSLNLAWAPWYHRSIIAAGTDSDRLIIYNFDEAQRLLSENEPNHIFDFDESQATVIFEAQLNNAVRLLKFSPVPSVPILAVCETNTFLTFIDCRTWHIERIALPQLPNPDEGEPEDTVVCGMAWSADASVFYVSSTAGIFKFNVKLLPSLSDRAMIAMVQNHDFDPAELHSLDSRDEMIERFNLMSFGLVRDKNAAVDWLDMDKLVPPPVVEPLEATV